MNKILAFLGREAAQVAAAISAGLQILIALHMGLTVDEQGAINAAVVVVLGALTAWAVSAEKAAPFLAGVVQAILSVAVSFGLDLTPAAQASVMAFVAAAVAIWLRSIVTAPVGPDAVRSARHAA